MVGHLNKEKKYSFLVLRGIRDGPFLKKKKKSLDESCNLFPLRRIVSSPGKHVEQKEIWTKRKEEKK
jgi:hypothetical protein